MILKTSSCTCLYHGGNGISYRYVERQFNALFLRNDTEFFPNFVIVICAGGIYSVHVKDLLTLDGIPYDKSYL